MPAAPSRGKGPAFQRSGSLDEPVRLNRGFALAIGRMASACGFSPRESEICTLIVRGLQSKEIASRLGRSLGTIGVIRARMVKKAGCSSTAELLARLAEGAAALAGVDERQGRSAGE